MKKFTINCDFGGVMSPFAVYIGAPKEGNHPLEHQAKWLADNRGGTIPPEVMDAVSKLQELAKKNNVPLEELCVYALGTEEEQAALATENGLVDEDENDENSEEENDQASDEAIAADNYGRIEEEDMAEEGGHIVDEELDQEDLESVSAVEGDAAEHMAEEGGHIVDEELDQEDLESASAVEGDAAEHMAEEGGPVVDEDLEREDFESSSAAEGDAEEHMAEEGGQVAEDEYDEDESSGKHSK